MNVTAWPKTDGLPVELTAALGLAWFTTCVSANDVLVAKFASPL